MKVLDMLFGEWRWYRRMRGGRWRYASCPDGGWFRDEKQTRYPDPDVEDYRFSASPEPEA